jgi:hypothetical protein
VVPLDKPRWSSSTFLLYLGAFTILAAASSAYGYLAGEYGNAAFAGWTLLMLAILAAIAVVFRRRSWITGGLFAYVAVAAFGTFVAAVFRWWGWGGTGDSLFAGWHWIEWLVIVLTLAAAVAALRAYRFPLLVFTIAVLVWVLVTDVVSGGGTWSAVVTLLIGMVYFGVAFAVGRVYGFWVHVASGLLIGGALLYWWHSSTADWVLLGIAGAVYITIGTFIGRSSWTVIGAVGLTATAAHFALKWVTGGGLFGIPTNAWRPIVVTAILGFVFVVLGLWAARRPLPVE